MSLQAIYNKLSIKHKLDEKIIKETIEELFFNIRKTISSNLYPKILIRNLGAFKIKPHKLKKEILRVAAYREGRSIDYLKGLLEKVNSYLRIQKENKTEDLEIETLKAKLENEIYTRSQ